MSNISCGIVGLPNVGKSSLYNALTKNESLVANYPFATIEPNVGIINVPDERLIKLQKLYQAEKITYANIKFVDIAGLVKGASNGEGLGNKFLGHIKQVDMILQVVRIFEDQDTIHVNNEINPQNDMAIVNTELVLTDLEQVNNQLNKIIKLAKNDKIAQNNLNLLLKIKLVLEKNQPLWLEKFSSDELILLKPFNFLTLKPTIYVFNLSETDLKNLKKQEQLTNLVRPSKCLFLSASLENDLKNFNDNEVKQLLEDYKIKESGLEILIKQVYETLNLQSFLTAGSKEVRAWTINKNTLAPDAAAVIHNDFKKGFIAAEIIDYNDLIKFGSVIGVKQAGKIRIEGKDYIMQPNDIVNFRFNL